MPINLMDEHKYQSGQKRAGKLLRKQRKEIGLAIEEIATVLFCSPQRIYQYEVGYSEAGSLPKERSQLLAIIKAYRFSLRKNANKVLISLDLPPNWPMLGLTDKEWARIRAPDSIDSGGVDLSVPTPVPKVFEHGDLFWNPRYKPRANERAHAVALRGFEVSLSLDPENDQAVDAVLTFHLIANEWRSIGSDQAPWLHLDFLDSSGKEIRIEGSKHWAEINFDYRENTTRSYARTLFTPHFADIKAVRIWAGAGYAQRDPNAPKEPDLVGNLVYPIMQLRAFIARLKRRLDRVFWVPKRKI